MQEKHDLGFTVLSDPGNGIARTLGILTQPSMRPVPRSWNSAST